MDDFARVGLRQRIGELNGEIERPPGVERPSVDHGAQRLARNELEHEIPSRSVLANLEQRRNAGMGERGGGARRLQEMFKTIGVGRQIRPEDLDRHRAAEPRIAGAEHLAQATRAHAVDDLVVADHVTRHRCSSSGLSSAHGRFDERLHRRVIPDIGFHGVQRGSRRAGATEFARAAGDNRDFALK